MPTFFFLVKIKSINSNSQCGFVLFFQNKTTEKSEKTENKSEKSSDVGLKQNIGLLAAVNIIIGVMIGSGIFISPTAALDYSGSVGMCLIIWALCGIVSLLGKFFSSFV